MIAAVTNIVAHSAMTPATIGLGVHPYAMFDPTIPMNVAAWTVFKGGSIAL